MTVLIHTIIYIAILLTGGVVGILKWSYLDKTFKLVCGLLLLTFVTETTSNICAYLIKSAVIVYNIFDPLEVIFFTLIFSNIFNNRKYKKNVIIFGVLISILIIATSVLKLQGRLINTVAVVIKSNFYIVLSLLKFKEILLNPEEDNLLKDPVFWFCSSVLFFFSISLLYFASLNYLQRFKFQPNLWWLMIYSNIIFYLLILYSLTLIKKNKKEYTLSDG